MEISRKFILYEFSGDVAFGDGDWFHQGIREVELFVGIWEL